MGKGYTCIVTAYSLKINSYYGYDVPIVCKKLNCVVLFILYDNVIVVEG